MATVKYFSGAIEVSYPRPLANAKFAEMFPDVRGKRWDGLSRMVADHEGVVLPVTRIIEYKSNPSLHKCDARCQHAKGRLCECSCGGRNHGVQG